MRFSARQRSQDLSAGHLNIVYCFGCITFMRFPHGVCSYLLVSSGVLMLFEVCV